MIRRLLFRLRGDERGVTLIEFAVVAPVMLLLLMGFCDLAYRSYVQAMLTGAMQKAGRDSTIQGSTTRTAVIDAKVMSWVKSVAPNATYSSSRESFAKFGDIRPEEIVNDNGNDVFDKDTECFIDINGSNEYDINPGRTGQGGASDVVVYKMTVTYPRLFPLYAMMGWPSDQQISAQTILKNQPWAAQNVYVSKEICPPPKKS